MPRTRIESIDDPRIAVYRDLPKSKLTRLSGLFIAEGKHLVDRLVTSGFQTHSLLVDEARLALLPDLLEGTNVYVTPPGLLEEVVGFRFHRGILGCGIRKQQPVLSELWQQFEERATVVVAVGVQDPENLGGILRNSAAFGVDLVVLDQRCADPFSRRALRVSMGGAFKLQIVESAELLQDLDRLRSEAGFTMIASVLQDDARPLENSTRPARIALLIGNEEQGLDEETVARCSRKVRIAMRRDTDSLNASVASAVFLYHFTRLAGWEV